ncbi:Inhibitor of growth protein 5 [Microtus ochrogaster]|uniref:Inhibitor of growth protein 5 n=1 Tax=Microtus ochrogaster TaxID=79684 RepID=A0A8J6GDL6_MICOH|nr:Inhibitor of growth protein 5 [Microtus ochrogaster]
MATAMYLEHYLDSKHLGRAARPRGSALPSPLAHRDPCGTPGCGREWGLVMGTSGGSRPFWGGVVDGGRIENLPCELQRNFQLMRELDQRTEDKKAEIDILAAEYISTVKTLSSDQRVEHLQKIQNAYSKCKEYSDDKVQLAMQTYEMVDKHIRRLDADLARFEADLKDRMDGSDFESTGSRSLKSKLTNVLFASDCSLEGFPLNVLGTRWSEFTDSILSVHPSDVLDMPVDPNEPTYCLCHQVSYGEMIGCDNPDCPIEWFHFACVDLTTKPKGKWLVWD